MNWDDVENAAKRCAGNHRKFDSFAWYARPEKDEDWAIFTTHHRDSGLLDESNEEAIEKELAPYTEGDEPDVRVHGARHWLVGWVGGWEIRVFKNGEVTEAFKTWCGIQSSLEDYPVLDEEDYSRREYEASLENIGEVGSRFLADGVPEGWEGEVYGELPDSEKCSHDDRGCYPSNESVKEALLNLGYLSPELTYQVIEVDDYGNENVIGSYLDEDDAMKHWTNRFYGSLGQSNVCIIFDGYPLYPQGDEVELMAFRKESK